MPLFNCFKADSLKEVLASAPGPSPWYLRSSGPELTSKQGTLAWSAADDGEISTGKVLLKTPNSEPLAIFDFHCYVLPLERNRFLVWHEEKDESLGQSFVKLLILDADHLEVLKATRTVFEEMKAKDLKVFHKGGEVSSYRIATSLNAGKHECTLPEEFMALDEILILVHSTAGNRKSNFYDEMHLCLFVVKPKERSLEIIPQDWFNEGSFDFGYQWPTRVARDPATGRVVGEGIRLGVFILDKSLRHVAKWLLEDHFYHPHR